MVKKMELPKLKAIEVELSDGQKVIIHEPKGREGLRAFLSAMPAMMLLQRVFSQMKDIQGGVIDLTAFDVPEEVIVSIHKLFGVMTDITVDEFEGMSVGNQIAMLQGFTLFTPKASAVTPLSAEAEIASTTPLTS